MFRTLLSPMMWIATNLLLLVGCVAVPVGCKLMQWLGKKRSAKWDTTRPNRRAIQRLAVILLRGGGSVRVSCLNTVIWAWFVGLCITWFAVLDQTHGAFEDATRTYDKLSVRFQRSEQRYHMVVGMEVALFAGVVIVYMGLAFYSLNKVVCAEDEWIRKWAEFGRGSANRWAWIKSIKREERWTARDFFNVYYQLQGPKEWQCLIPNANKMVMPATIPCEGAGSELIAIAAVTLLEAVQKNGNDKARVWAQMNARHEPEIVMCFPAKTPEYVFAAVWVTCSLSMIGESMAHFHVEVTPSIWNKTEDLKELWDMMDGINRCIGVVPGVCIIALPALWRSIREDWPLTTRKMRDQMPLEFGLSVDWFHAARINRNPENHLDIDTRLQDELNAMLEPIQREVSAAMANTAKIVWERY